MTPEEFIKRVNDKFLFQQANKTLLNHAEHYATALARENWPEVHSVTARYVNEHDITLDLAFHSEKDYVWWKLKNG